MGCYEGDFTIYDDSDVSALAPYLCITGNLTVSSTGLTALELPNLLWIGGNLLIDNNTSLSSLDGLSSLTSVSEHLMIRENTILPQCEACDLLDQLVGFSGTFDFYDNLADTCADSCI